MILIITNKQDYTADYLLLELQRRQVDYIRFNTEDFPEKVQVVWEMNDSHLNGYFRFPGSRVNFDEIKSIASFCTAFKIYLASTTGKLLFSDLGSLSTVLSQINESGRIPVVHAESEAIIRKHKLSGKNKMKEKSLHDHLLSRPNSAEVEAISNLLHIALQWESSKNNSKTISKSLKRNILLM